MMKSVLCLITVIHLYSLIKGIVSVDNDTVIGALFSIAVSLIPFIFLQVYFVSITVIEEKIIVKGFLFGKKEFTKSEIKVVQSKSFGDSYSLFRRYKIIYLANKRSHYFIVNNHRFSIHKIRSLMSK